jgi:hypothetical protein
MSLSIRPSSQVRPSFFRLLSPLTLTLLMSLQGIAQSQPKLTVTTLKMKDQAIQRTDPKTIAADLAARETKDRPLQKEMNQRPARQETISFGGGSTGGGDAVVCRDQGGKVKSIQFYDVYEAVEINGLNLNFGQAGLDYHQILDIAFQRIGKLNPSRAAKYRAQAEKFESDVHWVENKKLIDIPDEGIGYVPDDCDIEQLAIQNMNVYQGKRYLVNKTFFDRLAPAHQAAFILHEVIYTEYGPGKTSVEVRKFNSLIWSNGLAPMKLADYLESIRPLGFKTFDDHHQIECIREDSVGLSADGQSVDYCRAVDEKENLKVRSGYYLNQPISFALVQQNGYERQSAIAYDELGRFRIRRFVYQNIVEIAPQAKDQEFTLAFNAQTMRIIIPFESLVPLVSRQNPISLWNSTNQSSIDWLGSREKSMVIAQLRQDSPVQMAAECTSLRVRQTFNDKSVDCRGKTKISSPGSFSIEGEDYRLSYYTFLQKLSRVEITNPDDGSIELPINGFNFSESQRGFIINEHGKLNENFLEATVNAPRVLPVFIYNKDNRSDVWDALRYSQGKSLHFGPWKTGIFESRECRTAIVKGHKDDKIKLKQCKHQMSPGDTFNIVGLRLMKFEEKP